MTTIKPASARAIAAVVADAADAAEPEQLELLPPTRFAPGSAGHAELGERIKRERAGRPPGATNIATRQMLAYVRRVWGDPVERRARWLLHTPETLAAELDCSKVEAFDRLDRIAADLSRLFYPQLAPVDGAGVSVPPTFNLVLGGHQANGAAAPPWIYEGGPEVEQNQRLAEPAPDVSYGQPSYGNGK